MAMFQVVLFSIVVATDMVLELLHLGTEWIYYFGAEGTFYLCLTQGGWGEVETEKVILAKDFKIIFICLILKTGKKKKKKEEDRKLDKSM